MPRRVDRRRRDRRWDGRSLPAAWSLQPQVILLGLGKQGVTDLQVIPHLRTIVLAARIIVWGLLDVSGYRHAALAAGADAFVAKDALHSDLFPTLRRLGRAGESQIDAGCTEPPGWNSVNVKLVAIPNR